MIKKILIVDDTPGGLATLRDIFTQPRLTVFEAISGRQALEIHRNERVDLIMMDLQMRGMDGEQATRAIRGDKAMRDVSILLFTDNPRSGLRERCLACGANDFFHKPFKTAELLARVWSLLNVAARKPTGLLAHIEIEGDGSTVESFVARIVNLSTSGLLLEADASDTPLAVGRSVHLKFFVPGSAVQLSVYATVARRVEAGTTVRWGVRFGTVDPSMRQVIRDYVEGERDKRP